MATKQISRLSDKELSKLQEREIDTSTEAYIERLGGHKKRTQREMDLIFGGWV